MNVHTTHATTGATALLLPVCVLDSRPCVYLTLHSKKSKDRTNRTKRAELNASFFQRSQLSSQPPLHRLDYHELHHALELARHQHCSDSPSDTSFAATLTATSVVAATFAASAAASAVTSAIATSTSTSTAAALDAAPAAGAPVAVAARPCWRILATALAAALTPSAAALAAAALTLAAATINTATITNITTTTITKTSAITAVTIALATAAIPAAIPPAATEDPAAALAAAAAAAKAALPAALPAARGLCLFLPSGHDRRRLQHVPARLRTFERLRARAAQLDTSRADGRATGNDAARHGGSYPSRRALAPCKQHVVCGPGALPSAESHLRVGQHWPSRQLAST